MSIIATPVSVPSVPPDPLPAPSTPNPLYTVPLRITQVYDQRIPTKRRAVVVRQAQTAVLQVNLLNDLGNTVDLLPYNLPYSYPTDQIAVAFQEAIELRNSGIETTVAEIDDITTGLVAFQLPDAVVTCAGVYVCEIGVFDSAGRMHFSNQIFIIVERGLFRLGSTLNSANSYSGPPTLDEIRLSMRDNGPEDNRLIDDYEFDAAELAWAMIRSVQFWNTCQPPIGLFYDTVGFPLRDLWMDGICGQLFEMAANRYMRGDLQYSAGGLTVADQAKWQQYYTAGEKRWGYFVQSVRAKKVDINMQMAIGSLGSPYGRIAGSRF